MARWYAPAFVIGILLGWWNLKRLSRHRSSFVSTDPVNWFPRPRDVRCRSYRAAWSYLKRQLVCSAWVARKFKMPRCRSTMAI